MYDYTNMTQNVANLVNQINKGKIKFDIAIQRGETWDSYRKSLLIHSLLINMPIEPLLFVYNEKDKTYDVIQGKQRLKASIYNFVENNFKLHANTPPILDDQGNNVEIARRKFKDLPEEYQNKIKEYGLTIWRFGDIGQDEIDEMFFRINNGKPLTVIELTRTKMKDLETFQKIGHHDAIDIAISDAGKKRFANEQIAIQIWIMLFKESPNFLAKSQREMSDVVVSQDQFDIMIKSLDYVKQLYLSIDNTRPLYKNMRKRTHIVSLVYMAFLAIQSGINEEKFIEKATLFFNGDGKKATISNKYNAASGAGSAKSEQVRVRMEEIKNALK